MKPVLVLPLGYRLRVYADDNACRIEIVDRKIARLRLLLRPSGISGLRRTGFRLCRGIGFGTAGEQCRQHAECRYRRDSHLYSHFFDVIIVDKQILY